MVKAVLFDLDGTLVDTAADLANALNAMCIAYHRAPLPNASIRNIISDGSDAMLKFALGITADHPEFQDIKTKFLDYYQRHIFEETQLFDGVEPLLMYLDQQKIKWGIVTNKSTLLTKLLLNKLGLIRRGDCLVCGDTLAYSKPHPAPILYACDILDVGAAQTLYVGDAQGDVEAGYLAGTKVLIANYGYGGNGKPWGADGTINAPLELIAKLNEWSHIESI